MIILIELYLKYIGSMEVVAVSLTNGGRVMHNPQLTVGADNQAKRAPVLAPSDVPDVWILGAEINGVGRLIVAIESAEEGATYDGVLSVLRRRISARVSMGIAQEAHWLEGYHWFMEASPYLAAFCYILMSPGKAYEHAIIHN